MEVLMVMVIVAILAGLGVPSFTQFIRQGELTSRANSVIVALQLARSEAISRGVPVTACPSTDGETCSGTNWADGWIVVTDTSNPGTVDGDEEILRVDSNETQITTVDNDDTPDFVRFTGDGLNANDSSVIEMRRPECGTDRARVIEISATGRAQVNKADC